MSKEKELWKKLDDELSEVKSGKCGTLVGIYSCCNSIRGCMNEIIGLRGQENLDNKKAGVGVRGMRDILSGNGAKCKCNNKVNFLSGKVKIDDKDFESFCECLGAISKLPRGGFLWIGSSALSSGTKKLCEKAAEILEDNFKKLSEGKSKYQLEHIKSVSEGTESIARKLVENKNNLKKLLEACSRLAGGTYRRDEFGERGKWEKVDEMALSEVENHIRSLQAEVKELKEKKIKDVKSAESKARERAKSLREKMRVEEEKMREEGHNARISDSLLHENFRVKQEFKDSERQGNVRTEEQRKLKEQKRGWDEGQIGANIVSGDYDFIRDRFKEGQKPRDVGEQEDERFEVQGKLEEREKKELIGKLVACYEDQNKHIVNNWFGSWPLVTDSVTLSEWKAKDADCYEGEFSIKCSEKEYSICVYKLKCKDYNTKEDFDGPEIVKKLNKWSNDGKDVIVVEGTENK